MFYRDVIVLCSRLNEHERHVRLHLEGCQIKLPCSDGEVQCLVVRRLQRQRMGVERRRVAILDSVETELLTGVVVPVDNTFAGCNDVLDEHDFFEEE